MRSDCSPYVKHIYVCVNQRDPGVTCCAAGGQSGAASDSRSHAAGGRSGFASSSESHAHGGAPEAQTAGRVGGEAIREKLKAYVKANGLKGKVRVSKSGCMDLCAQGPNVMVYPGERWYKGVGLADVDEIIEKELAPLVVAGRHPRESEDRFPLSRE